jgi:hypothetical protein
MAQTTGEESTQSHNERMRVDALQRRIDRQEGWRFKVWAECELRIRTMQQEIRALGGVPAGPVSYDLTDEETLKRLAAGSATGSEDD